MVFGKRQCLFSKDAVSLCPLAREGVRSKVNTGEVLGFTLKHGRSRQFHGSSHRFHARAREVNVRAREIRGAQDT